MVGSQEARLRLALFARLMPNLLARNPQHLTRADLRYTNGFALTWGEEQGKGNGESGMAEAQRTGPAAPAVAFNRFPETAPLFPRLPIPHSPFPFPGFPSCTAKRSAEHTSELPSIMRISFAVFTLKKTTTSRIRTYKS